ncbi:hypothetical protein SAMN05444580_101240 [Rhodococcus tukisamuensis]|uniref:Uncharacterized protein n=1 Tax=Rhodococcus tukisamuensis TaxID=168276 RepID=A0A1G6MNM3_9NOCA|nr:hypothetical protein SAMN05444580_101240 [Rhodococcus tukisamuensis]
MADNAQPSDDHVEDIDDLEEPFISDDEPPRTVADFVRDSQQTSLTVDQGLVADPNGSSVSGGGWTSRSPE